MTDDQAQTMAWALKNTAWLAALRPTKTPRNSATSIETLESFLGRGLPNAWGQNGSEPGYLVKLGMTPLEAIEAATATGPLTLGPQAPRSGQLAEGYDADVITLDADPLADITVLADPAHITRVWTAGRQVKGTRHSDLQD